MCVAGISSRAEDGRTLAVAADGRFHSPRLGPRGRTDEKRRSALGQRGLFACLFCVPLLLLLLHCVENVLQEL